MIYINEQSTYIAIPKHLSGKIPYELTVKSPTLNMVLATDVEDISEEPSYYIFTIDPSQTSLTVGEYEYSLRTEEGEEIEVGLLTYGDYKRSDIVQTDMPTQTIQFQKR